MDSNLKNAGVSGQQLASFLTGLGTAGEGAGIVSLMYGFPIYEVPLAPEGHIVVLSKISPEIGDRRMIKFKDGEIIESDQRKYVVSERISLNYNWRDALCLIDNLSSTVAH
jgi:hypothetical protein